MRSWGPPARFVADSAGLDFLNSGGRSPGDVLDWLGTGEHLLHWLEQAELVPGPVLQKLARDTDSRSLDRVAAQARDLRNWLSGFVEQYRGRPLQDIDTVRLERLNRMLAEDQQYTQVVAPELKGANLILQAQRRWTTPEAVLWPIAEAVSKLLCEENFAQIKVCEGCSMVFIDRTRRQARKWCSMSTCGNRAKQAAHRSRRQPPRR